MKKSPQNPEDVLLDYLDGNLEASEREAVEQRLRTDDTFRQRLSELRNMDGLMRQLAAEQPSKNFTGSVMNNLDQYPLRTGLSIKNGILLLSGIMIMVGIAVVLLSAGVFDQTTNFDLNDLGLVQRYIRQTLPAIPVDGKILVNVIILLNLAVAFVVLDRAVLKPFFERRMQGGQ